MIHEYIEVFCWLLLNIGVNTTIELVGLECVV